MACAVASNKGCGEVRCLPNKWRKQGDVMVAWHRGAWARLAAMVAEEDASSVSN